MNKKTILAAIGLIGILTSALVQAQPAPDVELDTGKSSIQLKDLRGKVVYLDFWASWCVPCRKSFPWMNQVQKKFADQGFRIIAVNLDEDSGQARAFLAKYPAEFTVAYDPKGKLAQIFKVKGMPSSYLIDRNGNMIRTHIGFRSDDPRDLEAEIGSLLAK